MEDPSFDPEIAFGKVVGRFRLAVADGPDFGSEPDAEPDSGRIRFDPLLPYQRALLPVPETVSNRTQIYDLDAGGYLVDKQGERGVWLVVGAYEVSFKLKRSKLPPLTVLITADHTDLAPFDLAAVIPPRGAVLTLSQYTVLADQLARHVSVSEDGVLTISTPPLIPGSATPSQYAELARQVSELTTISISDDYVLTIGA